MGRQLGPSRPRQPQGPIKFTVMVRLISSSWPASNSTPARLKMPALWITLSKPPKRSVLA